MHRTANAAIGTTHIRAFVIRLLPSIAPNAWSRSAAMPGPTQTRAIAMPIPNARINTPPEAWRWTRDLTWESHLGGTSQFSMTARYPLHHRG